MAYVEQSRIAVPSRPSAPRPLWRALASWPRYVNIGLGAWLFASAFVWRHSPASGLNTCIVGALIACAAVLGLRQQPGRFAASALALWLMMSSSALHLSALTFFNNILIAVLVLLFSVIPDARGPEART